MSANEGGQGAGPSAEGRKRLGWGRRWGWVAYLRAVFRGGGGLAPAVSPTIAQVVLPVPVRFKQIEERLRTSLKGWQEDLVKLRGEREKQLLGAEMGELLKEKKVVPGPWFVIVDSIRHELDEAMTDFRTIREDLEVAKIEADYGSVLVGAWPANHYLDRMAYVGGALTGLGGAAFLVGTSIIQQTQFWFVPAIGLWSLGLALLVYALYGLADWERDKFGFFAWKLAVPEQYRPRIFRKSPFSQRLERLPEQLRVKLRKLSAERPPT